MICGINYIQAKNIEESENKKGGVGNIMITMFDVKVTKQNLQQLEQIEDYLFKLTDGRKDSALADIWKDLFVLLSAVRKTL